SVDPPLALVAGLGEAPGGELAALEVVEDDGLGGGVVGAGVGDRGGDGERDGGDAVTVAVEQGAGVDHDPADVDVDVDAGDVTVPVRADGAAGEAGEGQGLDLVEVAAGPAGDQSGGAEGLVGGTHDLAEGGGGDGVVEVLE